MNLSEILEPIADLFRKMEIPGSIVHWGHPLMMGIVIFVMGSFVGWAGWRGRLVTDPDAANKSKTDHRKIAPLMFLFLAAGYTGGLLSLVMQHQPILESYHFWTASIVLILLIINAAIALGNFGKNKNKVVFRNVHAYIISIALGLLFLHALLGLKLGLSI